MMTGRAGRRSGIRVRNNVRKNPDGTDVFQDYFETTAEETTVLGTDTELQDTAPNYDIDYTGVSLQCDTSNTNQYSLMALKSPLRIPRMKTLSSRKRVRGRKVGRPKKKSQKKLATSQNSESEFFSPEKTYVDKSVITSPASFTRASLALSRYGLNRSTESLNIMSMNIDSPSTSIREKVESLTPKSISKTVVGLGSSDASKILRSKKSSIPISKTFSGTYQKKSTSLISTAASTFSRQADKTPSKEPMENVSSLAHQSISKSIPGSKSLDSSKTERTVSSSFILKSVEKGEDSRESSLMNSQENSQNLVSSKTLSSKKTGNKNPANEAAEKAASLTPKGTSKSYIDSENLESSRTLRSGRVYTPTDKNVSKSSLQNSKKKLKPSAPPAEGANPESNQQRDLSNQENAPEEPMGSLSPLKRISTIQDKCDDSSPNRRFREVDEQNSGDVSQNRIARANKTFNNQTNSMSLNSSILTSAHKRIVSESELRINKSMPESQSRSADKSLDKDSSKSRRELNSSRNIQSTSSQRSSKSLVQEMTDNDHGDPKVLKKSHQGSVKRNLFPRTETHLDREKSREEHVSSQNINSRLSDSDGEAPGPSASYLSPTPEVERHSPKKNTKKTQQPSSNLSSRCNKVNQNESQSKSISFKNKSLVENSRKGTDERHELNVSETHQVPIVKSNQTFTMNHSKSGKRTDSSRKVDDRLHNSEVITSHESVVIENEQLSDVSLLRSQSGRANTHSNLETLDSMMHSRRIIYRDDQQTSPKSNSVTVAKNVSNKDAGNSMVLEKSTSQVKRKRKSTPLAKERVDKRISGDNIQPSSQSSEALSNQTNSTLTQPGTSGHNEKNRQPKPKKPAKRKKTKSDWDRMPSPTPYVRERPKRNRIPPLAYWKGESRTFRYTKEGEIVLVETNLVNDPSMRHPSRGKKPKAKKQKKEDDVLTDQDQLLFYDEASGSEIELVGMYQNLKWESGSPSGSSPSYKIARLPLVDKFSAGYLEFDVNGIKDKQYSPTSNLCFVVLEGIVKFKIADNVVKVGRKSSVFVPCRTPYSIKNCFQRKSLLYFSSSADD